MRLFGMIVLALLGLVACSGQEVLVPTVGPTAEAIEGPALLMFYTDT